MIFYAVSRYFNPWWNLSLGVRQVVRMLVSGVSRLLQKSRTPCPLFVTESRATERRLHMSGFR